MPETTQQINTLLSSIESLREAKVIRALPGGPASDSFQLQIGDQHFVARVDRPAARALGLDRHAETAILQLVSEAGIGPQLFWADPDRGIQVCSYIEGSSWTLQDLGDPRRLRQLALTLRRLHQLPPVGRAFEPAAAAQRYAAEIGTATAKLMAESTLELIANLDLEFSRPALCHNDLVYSNIIGQGPVTLIDWEYAAVGDPFFDLAIVLRHHQLSKTLTEVFLRAYAERWAPWQFARLEAFCELYDHLAALWYLAMVRQDATGSSFDSDLERVMLRMSEPGLTIYFEQNL